MQPVPRSFQAHRPVLDEAWPAQPPGSRRYDPKQNFRLPLELEILTNRRCAPIQAVIPGPPLEKIRGLNYGVVQMMKLLQVVGRNGLATVAGLGDFAAFASRAFVA